MKIVNNTIPKYNPRHKKNINFNGLSPQTLTKVKTLSSNEYNKKLLVKLATLSGLSSIVSWVNSLKKGNIEETQKKLDIIDTFWTTKGNSAFLNPKTQEQYLNLVSNSDNIESLLELKAKKNEKGNEISLNKIPEEMEKAFLSTNENEDFLSVSADKNFKSINMQIEALNNTTEEQLAETIKAIDTRILNLSQIALDLKNNEISNQLYEKLANIYRMFAITSLIEEHPENTTEAHLVKDINEDTKITTSESISEEESQTTNTTTENEDLDYKASEEAKKLIDINIIDNPELKAQLARNLGQSALSTIKKETPKDLIYTEKNRNFIDNIFITHFKNTNSNIDPKVYSENIDLIQDIYEYYAKNKESLDILHFFSRSNINKELSLYNQYYEDLELFEFLNFYKLQNFKTTRCNGSDITKEEFDLLAKHKENNTLAFIEAPLSQSANGIKVQFTRNASAEERLKVLSDVYRIAFSKDEKILMAPDSLNEATPKDIAHEIAIYLARAIEKQKDDDYENILNFLKIDKESILEKLREYGIIGEDNTIGNDVDKEASKEEFMTLIEEIEKSIINLADENKMKTLEKLLNYKKFNGFMSCTHVKLRFLSRKLFNDLNNHELQLTTLNKKLKDAINSVKSNIESQPFIVIFDYISNAPEGIKRPLCGGKVTIKDTTMGINNNGEIHTIYYKE